MAEGRKEVIDSWPPAFALVDFHGEESAYQGIAHE